MFINTSGLFGVGLDSNVNRRGEMLFISIDSTVSSSNFGELNPSNGTARMAGCASTTRGIFGGGQMPDGFGGSTAIDVIQLVNIGTTGNATEFGDLTVARQIFAGCSYSTRGRFGGRKTDTETIEHMTRASTGDATEFGSQ